MKPERMCGALARQSQVLLAACVLLVLSGCFVYVPVERGGLSPGDDVRVTVTREGYVNIPTIPGQTGLDLVGRLVALDQNDSLVVRLPIGRSAGEVVGQDVRVSFHEVAELRRKEFSRNRTLILAAGGFAVAGVALASVITSRDGGGGDLIRPPPSGEDNRYPVGVRSPR